MLRNLGKAGINTGFGTISSGIGGAISYAYAKKWQNLIIN